MRKTVGGTALALVALLFLLLTSASAKTREWTAQDYPNPNTDPKACGRGSIAQSSVCDPDGLLTTPELDNLEGIINAIRNGEEPFAVDECGSVERGYQVAVALVRKMSSDWEPSRSTEERAKRFAKALHDSWGVGDEQCENGVLLFLSMDDRFMYISTGAGAKERLTEERITNIIQTARELLRQNKFPTAVRKIVYDIGVALSGPPSFLERHSYLFPSGAVLALFGFFMWRTRRQRKRFLRIGDVRKRLERLQRERDQAQSGGPSYQASSCPICLEDFAAQEPRQVLPCGHPFHHTCVAQWLQTSGSNSCPVCRTSVFDEGDTRGRGEARGVPPPPLARPSHHGNEDDSSGGSGGGGGGAYRTYGCQRARPEWYDTALYNDELNFRLRRLHHMYPDILTLQLINDWNMDTQFASEFERSGAYTQLQSFMSDGARGAGASFGGGSSMGGGGGGGGW